MQRQQTVEILNYAETLSLSRDAKIVAIRWDLIPWCLVLDFDAPVEEEVKDTPTRRAWLVFVGLSEVSFAVEAARLPNGIFSTNPIIASESSSGFFQYELPFLAPTFSITDELSNNPHSKMKITAKGLLGAGSIAAFPFEEFGPNRQQRHSLATDEDFLDAIGDVWKNVVLSGGKPKRP